MTLLALTLQTPKGPARVLVCTRFWYWRMTQRQFMTRCCPTGSWSPLVRMDAVASLQPSYTSGHVCRCWLRNSRLRSSSPCQATTLEGCTKRQATWRIIHSEEDMAACRIASVRTHACADDGHHRCRRCRSPTRRVMIKGYQALIINRSLTSIFDEKRKTKAC